MTGESDGSLMNDDESNGEERLGLWSLDLRDYPPLGVLLTKWQYLEA